MVLVGLGRGVAGVSSRTVAEESEVAFVRLFWSGEDVVVAVGKGRGRCGREGEDSREKVDHGDVCVGIEVMIVVKLEEEAG